MSWRAKPIRIVVNNEEDLVDSKIVFVSEENADPVLSPVAQASVASADVSRRESVASSKMAFVAVALALLMFGLLVVLGMQ